MPAQPKKTLAELSPIKLPTLADLKAAQDKRKADKKKLEERVAAPDEE